VFLNSYLGGMKAIIPYMLLLSFVLLFNSCTRKKINASRAIGSVKDESEQSAKSMSNHEFSFLDDLVKGKRIVAVGESSHGIGEFYSLKTEMVKYLHQELGYQVLAMEGGYGDINLAWEQVDALDAKSLRDKTVFGNFKCEEVEPLFEYIKGQSLTNDPLFYTGYDCQTSSDLLADFLDTIVSSYNSAVADSLTAAFGSYYQIYPSVYHPDSTLYIYHTQRFLKAVSDVKHILDQNAESIPSRFQLSDKEFNIINKSVGLFHKAIDIPYADRLYNGNNFKGVLIRDQLMFQNLKWLLENPYNQQKIILWAHNAHIQEAGINGDSSKLMGQLLADEYGDDYVSIGLFAYQGRMYQHWTRDTVSFENSDTSFFEYQMMKYKKPYHFIDFTSSRDLDDNQWMFNEITALELENGGEVRFIPADRFDAAICIKEADVPTF